MKKIGITGGICSGKTTVCDLFSKKGIPIFNTDNSSRDIMLEKSIQDRIKLIVGKNVFPNGVIDRTLLRSLIFTDSTKLKKVNELIIPLIKEKYDSFVKINSKSPFTLLEAATIFETGNEHIFDKIITIIARRDVRIRRMIERDNLSEIEIQNKMNNQLSDFDRIVKSDFVIINNGKDDIEKQVNLIYNTIISSKI